MDALKPRRWIVVVALASLAGCSGPCLLALAEIDTIQLETNPVDPYSVNIWVVGLGPHLYVHAGANRATWIEHMQADPRVRLRAGESIYELSAARVTEQAEFDRFSRAYEAKYGLPPRNGDVGEAHLYRLSPR